MCWICSFLVICLLAGGVTAALSWLVFGVAFCLKCVGV